MSFPLVRGCLCTSISCLGTVFQTSRDSSRKGLAVGPLQISHGGHSTFSGCLESFSQLASAGAQTLSHKGKTHRSSQPGVEHRHLSHPILGPHQYGSPRLKSPWGPRVQVPLVGSSAAPYAEAETALASSLISSSCGFL